MSITMLFLLIVAYFAGVMLGVGLISKEKLEEVRAKARKELGRNYRKFLPKYEIVSEIPPPEKREKGVKYVTSEEARDVAEYIDTLRLLHGERVTITDTPLHLKSFDEIRKDELRKALSKDVEDVVFSRILSNSGDLDSIDYDEVRKGVVREMKKRIESSKKSAFSTAYTKGGCYRQGEKKIEVLSLPTQADIDMLNIPEGKKRELVELIEEERDYRIESTSPHEEWHGYSGEKCNEFSLKYRGVDRESIIRRYSNAVKELEEVNYRINYLTLKLMQLESQEKKALENEDYDRYFEITEKKMEIQDKLLKEKKRRIALNEKYSNIIVEGNKLKYEEQRLGIDALDEGIAFALSEYYSGKNVLPIESAYSDVDKIYKVKEIASKFLSFGTPENLMRAGVEAMEEAYRTGRNAVEVFKERLGSYEDAIKYTLNKTYKEKP